MKTVWLRDIPTLLISAQNDPTQHQYHMDVLPVLKLLPATAGRGDVPLINVATTLRYFDAMVVQDAIIGSQKTRDYLTALLSQWIQDERLPFRDYARDRQEKLEQILATYISEL